MNDSDQDDQTPKQLPAKESPRKFVLRMSQPFLLDTEGLGQIQGRHLTMKGFQTLLKRMRSVKGVDDDDLVRAYIGAVSGFPIQDDEALPEPLSEEEVAKLTPSDINAFARTYLTEIGKAAKVDHPVPELAAFIRAERARIEDSFKQAADAVRSAVDVQGLADVMKNWRALSTNIAGSMGSLRDEMKSVFGAMGVAGPTIGEALRNLQEDRQSQMAAIFGRNPQTQIDNILGRSSQAELDGILGRSSQAQIDGFMGRSSQAEIDAILGRTTQAQIDAITGRDLKSQIDAITGRDLESHIDAITGRDIQSQIDEILGGDRQAQIDALLGRDQQRIQDIVGDQGTIRGLLDAEQDELSGRLGSIEKSLFEHRAAPTPPPVIGRIEQGVDFSFIRALNDEGTPVSRTAVAVEELRQAGARMEDAMGLIVEQAGNVSSLVGQVVVQIKEEAGKSQKGARLALVIACLALVLSALFSLLGYWADRADARSDDQASNRVVAELAQQNQVLREMLARSRAEATVPPKVSAAPQQETEPAPKIEAPGESAKSEAEPRPSR